MQEKFAQEKILKELGLNVTELASLVPMGMLPLLLPASFAIAEKSFQEISAKDFSSMCAHILEDYGINLLNVDLLKYSFRTLLLDSTDNHTLLKYLNEYITTMLQIETGLNSIHKAILCYAKALSAGISEVATPISLMNTSNSFVVNRIDRQIIAKDDLPENLSAFINDEQRQLLRNILITSGLELHEE